jgi:hypothetical protein
MSKFQIINSSGELEYYPKVLPTLDLNFETTKTLDPRITFTRSSGGTYVDEAGIIRIAGVNQPRFDHNPATGESLGLLVEEARVNNQSNSNTFSSGWSDLVAVSLQNNLYPDPFGTNTATRIIPTSTSTEHYIGRYQGYGTGAYAHSIFVKPAGYSRLLVSVNGSTFTANFSGAGSFTNTNATTYATKIQAFANGWYRLEWTWNNGGGGGANTLQPRITILNNSGSSTFAGDGVSGVDVFGYQQEGGLFSTSYIPTTGSAVTRSVDAASMTGTNFSSVFNVTGGTMVAEYYRRAPQQGNGNYIWSLGGGAPSFAYNNVGGYLELDFALSLGLVYGTALTGKNKSAFKFQQGSYAAIVNGGTIATSSNATGWTPTSLLIGGGSYFLLPRINSPIARLTYYTAQLPNNQLKFLTE